MLRCNPLHTPLFLFCLTLSKPAFASEALTLDQVLGNHFEATGGIDQIHALTNLRLHLRIWEPEFEVEAIYRANSDGRMRIDIFDGERRVFSEGIDDRGGWQQNGAGTEILAISQEGMLALQRGIQRNLHGLAVLSTQGSASHLLELQQVDGTLYEVVSFSESDGTVRQLFINRDNWLVERSRETKALHPDLDATRIFTEERHSDFRELCGVLRSFQNSSYDLNTAERIQSTEILDGSCNADNDELNLSRPVD